MTPTTTLENITNAQIRALRDECRSAGDHLTVDLCNRALTSDDDVTDQDGNPICLAEMPQDEARASVVEIIRDGEAAREEVRS